MIDDNSMAAVASLPGEISISLDKFLIYRQISGIKKLFYKFILSKSDAFLEKYFSNNEIVYDWILKKAHFEKGCINASIVIDKQKGLLATFTNLRYGGELDRPTIKITKVDFDLIKNVSIENNQLLPTVALYGPEYDQFEFVWEDFYPLLPHIFTDNYQEIDNAFNKLNNSDWERLSAGLAQINDIYREGLYPVEISRKLMKANEYNPEVGHKYEQWTYYFGYINQQFSSVFVDLGINDFAPIINKEVLLQVAITVKEPTEEGFVFDHENEELVDIEDLIIARIPLSYDAIFCGRITANGVRNLYFYLNSDENIDQYIHEVMEAYDDYEYGIGTNIDTDWNFYIDILYPNEFQRLSIKNRKGIDSLVEGGDDLSQPRMVTHWLHFVDEYKMDDFSIKAELSNFEIVKKEHNVNLGSKPFRIEIKRIEQISWASLDDCTFLLSDLAQKYNGEYDGWETTIETIK